MANFESVLAGIPGYGGYLAKDQLNRRNTLSDLQQVQGAQGLMAQMQQQQMAQGIRGVLSDATIPDDQKIQRLSQFGEPGIKVAQSLAQMQKQTADMAEQKRLRELRPALMAKYTTPAQPAVAGNVTPTGGMMGFQSGIEEDDGAQGVNPAVPAGFDTRGYLREAATQGLIPTETYFNHEAQLEDRKAARASQQEDRKAAREAAQQNLIMQLASKELTAQQHQQTLIALKQMGIDSAAALKAATVANGGKPPMGYRFKADGSLEAIPGGPADNKIQGQENQATAAFQSGVSDLDRLALEANKLLTHPGLPGITGLRGAIPNIPGTDAANAQSLLETLKSQIGFSVLQTMRNNSKTGGALGSVSDAEGKRLEANLASLAKAQDLKQFKESLGQIINFTESAKGRLRGAYNMRPANNTGGATGGFGGAPANAATSILNQADAILGK